MNPRKNLKYNSCDNHPTQIQWYVYSGNIHTHTHSYQVGFIPFLSICPFSLTRSFTQREPVNDLSGQVGVVNSSLSLPTIKVGLYVCILVCVWLKRMANACVCVCVCVYSVFAVYCGWTSEALGLVQHIIVRVTSGFMRKQITSWKPGKIWVFPIDFLPPGKEMRSTFYVTVCTHTYKHVFLFRYKLWDWGVGHIDLALVQF